MIWKYSGNIGKTRYLTPKIYAYYPKLSYHDISHFGTLKRDQQCVFKYDYD